MPEILAKHTKIPIQIMDENTLIAHNTIYLLPTGKNSITKEGRFHLSEQTSRPHNNYPIDLMFESVAINYKKKAIAVILSGTGRDGSQGIIHIAKQGGMVLVQRPDEAQFSGMPQSAIETDVVTHVLPVKQLAEAIAQLSTKSVANRLKPVNKKQYYNADHEQLFSILLKKFKVDFNQYKVGTIFRRIERRIKTLHLANLQEYVSYLHGNEEEIDTLYKDLLIGVTLFFRDPEAFKLLEKKIVPLLFEKQQRTGDDIRVWCPACSTGEEAYSIAILLFEYAEKHKQPLNIKLYATDISTDFLSTASNGIYSAESIQYVSQKRLQHYFIPQDNHYKIIKPIRDLIIFAPHNLMASPPFIKMDLISCRNFLIYITPPMQQKILSYLHLGLNTGGFLFLGPSESIGELSPYVETLNTTWKLYKKTCVQPTHLLFNNNGGPSFTHTSLLTHRIERYRSPLMGNDIKSQIGDITLPIYVYQALVKDFVPCGFIIDESHKIVHVFGRAGEFIFYQEGIATLDITSLILEPLKSPLNAALYEAQKSKNTRTYDHIQVTNTKGELIHVRLVVKPILTNNYINYYCISIQPTESNNIEQAAKPDGATMSMIYALENKLQQTSESLKNSIEEFEIANAELLTANEELQSTNEELQSVNEVLYTANSEHQKKIIELRDAHTNIDNLLRSTEIGAIFVDTFLRIRMFTPVIAKFFDLIESDTGRSIKSFIFRASFKDLTKKIEWVIKKNRSFETELVDDKSQWYLLRIFPYLKNGHTLDGAIITMTNINEIRQSKIKLEETNAKLTLALKSSHIGLWRWDFEKDIVEHDKNITELFGLTKNKKIKNYKQFEQLVFDEDRKNVSQLLSQAKKGQPQDFYMEFRVLWPNNTLHYLASRGHIYQDEKDNNTYLTGACWDISNHIHIEESFTHKSIL